MSGGRVIRDAIQALPGRAGCALQYRFEIDLRPASFRAGKSLIREWDG
jgi:hypothetical protein